jgi:hypothetical protein
VGFGVSPKRTSVFIQFGKPSFVRSVPLTLSIFSCSLAAFASEIREFDIKTIERLGNELARVSQQSERGATTAERKRAKQTAVAALRGRLFDIHYNYVVLDDPDGSGFLVYALGTTMRPGETVLAGHFRVTVSADGEKADRVDALSRSLVINRAGERLPVGSHQVGMYMVQIVSSKPVETLIYTNRITNLLIVVATMPDGRIFEIENGKVKDTGKMAGKK